MGQLTRYGSYACLFAAGALMTGLIVTWTGADTGTLQFMPACQRIAAPLHEMEECDLDAVIVNGTRRSVTLLGASGFCGSRGCAQPSGFPHTLKPGFRGHVLVHFTGGEPGTFAHEIPVYTNHPRQPQVMLRFTGEVLDTKPVAVSTSSETSKPVHW